MNDYLCVAVCPKAMPFGDEPSAQLDIVINLTVEHDPQRVVLVAQRLVAAGDVYDGEPAKSQRRVVVNIESVIVRSSVRDDVGHASEERARTLSERCIPTYESG